MKILSTCTRKLTPNINKGNFQWERRDYDNINKGNFQWERRDYDRQQF